MGDQKGEGIDMARDGWSQEFLEDVRIFSGFEIYAKHVTHTHLNETISNIGLAISGEKDVETLLLSIRGFIGVAIRAHQVKYINTNDEIIGNSIISKNLLDLADRCKHLHNDIVNMPISEWSAIHRFGNKRMESKYASVRDDELNYLLSMKQINWLQSYLEQAALYMASGENIQKPRWRGAAERELRIECGIALARIYEEAFGKEITINNCTKSKSDEQTSFMKFYEEMMDMFTDGLTVATDIPGVLREARSRYREYKQKGWSDRTVGPDKHAPLSVSIPLLGLPPDD